MSQTQWIKKVSPVVLPRMVRPLAPRRGFSGLLLALCVVGCDSGLLSSGDGAGSDHTALASDLHQLRPRSCAISDLNQWVLGAMTDYYLFFDQVDSNTPIADHEHPETLIERLRVPPDQFSYVTDEGSYNSFFSQGETRGYGWHFAAADWSDENQPVLFSLIDPLSPLDLQGVRRGDRLIAINTLSPSQYSALSREERVAVLEGSDGSGTISLSVVRGAEAVRTFNVTPAIYRIDAVQSERVLDWQDQRIGYLNFYQFIGPASAELKTVFEDFKRRDIQELVIDLRFNTGGRVFVASELAAYVIGATPAANHAPRLFTRYAHNARYADQDVNLYLPDLTHALSLNRVFVLQSRQTCSASELIVNSLRPYIPVITIGERSCGKPYATSPNSACGKVINALEIELLNADGVGGYYDGITADCDVAENVDTDLASIEEPLLKSALFYMQNGYCPADIDALTTTARRADSKNGRQRLTGGFRPEWQGGAHR